MKRFIKSVFILLGFFFFFFPNYVIGEESDDIVPINEFLDYKVYSNPAYIEYRLNFPKTDLREIIVNNYSLTSPTYYFIQEFDNYCNLCLEGYYIPGSDKTIYSEVNNINISYIKDGSLQTFDSVFYLSNIDFSPVCSISTSIWHFGDSEIVFNTNGPLNTMRMIFSGPNGEYIDATEGHLQDLFQFDYETGTVVIPADYLSTLKTGSYQLTVQWPGYYKHMNIDICDADQVLLPINNFLDLKGKPSSIQYRVTIPQTQIKYIYINNIMATQNIDYRINTFDTRTILTLITKGHGCDNPNYTEGENKLSIEYGEIESPKVYETSFTVINTDFNPNSSISAATWNKKMDDLVYQTDGPIQDARVYLRKDSEWEFLISASGEEIANNENLLVNYNEGTITIKKSYLETLDNGEYTIWLEWGWGTLDETFSIINDINTFEIINDSLDFSDPYWGNEPLDKSRISLRYYGEKEDITEVQINGTNVQYRTQTSNGITKILVYGYEIKDKSILNEGQNELIVKYKIDGIENSYNMPIYFSNIGFDPNCSISSNTWTKKTGDIYINVNAPLENTGFRFHCSDRNGNQLFTIGKNGENTQHNEDTIVLDDENHRIVVKKEFFIKYPEINQITFEISWKGYYYNTRINVVDPTIIVEGSSLALTESIGLNFYLTIPEEIPDTSKIVFTHKDKEVAVDISKPTSTSSGMKIYTLYIPIKELSDTVNLKAEYENGDPIALASPVGDFYPDGYDYTAMTYVANAKKADKKDEKLIALLDAMVNFSNTARKQFNYKADTATVDESALAGIDVTTLANYKVRHIGTEPEGIHLAGYVLGLESSTVIKHYFELTGDEPIESFVFETGYGEDESTYKEVTPIKYGNYYRIDIAAVAKYLDRDYTVRVRSASSQEGYSCVYSALSYGYGALDSNDTSKTLADVVKAMYVYNRKAKIYFNIPDDERIPSNNSVLIFDLLDNNTYSVKAGIDASDVDTIVIPETYNNLIVSSISDNGFNGLTNLNSIVIPNSISIIGNDAFRGCSSLTSITIPKNVTTIGSNAFVGSGLTSASFEAPTGWSVKNDASASGVLAGLYTSDMSWSKPVKLGKTYFSVFSNSANVQKYYYSCSYYPENPKQFAAALTKTVSTDATIELRDAYGDQTVQRKWSGRIGIQYYAQTWVK